MPWNSHEQHSNCPVQLLSTSCSTSTFHARQSLHRQWHNGQTTTTDARNLLETTTIFAMNFLIVLTPLTNGLLVARVWDIMWVQEGRRKHTNVLVNFLIYPYRHCRILKEWNSFVLYVDNIDVVQQHTDDSISIHINLHIVRVLPSVCPMMSTLLREKMLQFATTFACCYSMPFLCHVNSSHFSYQKSRRRVCFNENFSNFINNSQKIFRAYQWAEEKIQFSLENIGEVCLNKIRILEMKMWNMFEFCGTTSNFLNKFAECDDDEDEETVKGRFSVSLSLAYEIIMWNACVSVHW